MWHSWKQNAQIYKGNMMSCYPHEIIEEVKIHLRKCSKSSLTLPVEELRDVVEEMHSQDAVKPELDETINKLIASVDAEP
eukprot:1312112-Ditylum_brightwellii.AAC.1